MQICVEGDFHAFAGIDLINYKGLECIPGMNSQGQIFKYTSNLKNLRIMFLPYSGKCVISNSLHKYAHEFNYTDFTMTDLKNTVAELSDILSLDISNAAIRKIEYGCNIELPDPDIVCADLHSYKANNYRPVWSKKLAYGASCFFANYVLKAYNKTMQVKAVDKINLPEKLFRWEIKITSMAALHKRKIPIAVEKVKDLFNLENAQMLCEDLIDKYDNSVKKRLVNLSDMSLREITAFSRMLDTRIANLLHSNHRQTYGKTETYLTGL